MPTKLAKVWRIASSIGWVFRSTNRCSTAREQVANRLANALLLPRRWFAADGLEHDWDLLELKEHYVTASHELIARRMLDMRSPIVITVCDQGRDSLAAEQRVQPRLKCLTKNATRGELPITRAFWLATHSTGKPAWSGYAAGQSTSRAGNGKSCEATLQSGRARKRGKTVFGGGWLTFLVAQDILFAARNHRRLRRRSCS